MNYSEYRHSYKTAEEFMQTFGKLSEEEACALISTTGGSTAIKACAITTRREAKKEFEQERVGEVNRFASKWLERFRDPNVNYLDLVDHRMADDCRSLGFEMDCAHAFSEKYAVAFNDCHALSKSVNEITDISLLGSAIFSKWRYFNHWAYCGDEILEPENREWFIIALSRLRDLTEKTDHHDTDS